MSQLSTSPSYFEIGTGETLPLSFDASAYLGSGESVASATVTVTRQDTGASVPAALSGSPSISGGDTVLQIVLGSALVAGVAYLIRVTVTITPSSKVEEMLTQMRCVA